MKRKLLLDLITESLEFGCINEAGLSRILQRIDGRMFCIATAFRYSNSLNQNRALNRELLQILNRNRMGGYMLIGHWQEAPDGIDYQDADPDQLTDSVEESILFTKPEGMSEGDFKDFCVAIANKYNQDAVIVGTPGNLEEDDDQPDRRGVGNMSVYLVYKNGNSDKIGSRLSLGKISQAYSQLKQKPNIPFVFEGNLEPVNDVGKRVFKLKNILYS